MSEKPIESPPAATTRSPSLDPTLHSSTDAELGVIAMAAGKPPVPIDGEASDDDAHHVHPLAQLGAVRKNFLLFIFAVATFVDVCNVSGVAIAVAQIGMDTGLHISQLVWIITAYSLSFSAFLLFAGRLSDLFPASVIFEAGFAILGIFSLVTSFVTSDKYGFLVLRGLGGVSGAMTIPSAYHLLVHMFPEPNQQQQKLGMLGLAGASGNVLGLVLAGLCMLASYKWFFRLMAIICISFSAMTIFLLPYTGSSYAQGKDSTPRWKRMDVIGVLILEGALICFILALTQGPIDGWNSASFIAPFILAFPLGVGFFFWESRIPPKSAVLPSSVWKITNVIISSLAVLFPFAFWATSQLQYATFWQEVLHWSPIHVAAAMLPQGIIGLIIGGLAQPIPGIINRPRISLPIGAVLIIIAEILQVYSDGGRGMNYWRYCFPAFIIGSAGAMITYFASAINLISYCPPSRAGVAGAWCQVLAQVGGAICLAVQAGLQTDDLADWKKSSGRAYWFMVAWVAVLSLQYLILYRKPASVAEEHERAMQRIRDAGKE
ncbi:major facilitator superfamily domain-containing protein [Kockovaella imperatae]|uniref:Major facilitator superfamily domain-containing protein n=1 Tax=Kockovaella imperatae TaxID=4999 RepID=A0A1Y1UEY7_9TREE|nr:major facilitator superfamily domain-containing protein [Kockovaella imperatae]ORX36582.1 major facilitator superfamily domain-containing protein [Kockovaella imperatae]